MAPRRRLGQAPPRNCIFPWRQMCSFLRGRHWHVCFFAAAVYFVMANNRTNFNNFLVTMVQTVAVRNVTTNSNTTARGDKGVNNAVVTVDTPDSNTTARDRSGVNDASTTVYTGMGPSSPLKPPFKIVQFGIPRTGSTFQTVLLDAIIRMKSPNSTTIDIMYNSDHLDANDLSASFIAKVHFLNNNPKLMEIARNVSFFTSVPSHNSLPTKMSKERFPYPVIYSQSREDLLNCSLCEVERYAPIFDLAENEITNLRAYMEGYQIIRRCCGFQMSKYEMARLNGCDMSEYRLLPEYPKCEAINKTEVEKQFANNPGGIRLREISPKNNWAKVGDCRRMDGEIRKGFGLNKKKFPGCNKALN